MQPEQIMLSFAVEPTAVGRIENYIREQGFAQYDSPAVRTLQRLSIGIEHVAGRLSEYLESRAYSARASTCSRYVFGGSTMKNNGLLYTTSTYRGFAPPIIHFVGRGPTLKNLIVQLGEKFINHEIETNTRILLDHVWTEKRV